MPRSAGAPDSRPLPPATSSWRRRADLLSGRGELERLNFLQVLGIQPRTGRLLTPAERKWNGPKAVRLPCPTLPRSAQSVRQYRRLSILWPESKEEFSIAELAAAMPSQPPGCASTVAGDAPGARAISLPARHVIETRQHGGSRSAQIDVCDFDAAIRINQSWRLARFPFAASLRLT